MSFIRFIHSSIHSFVPKHLMHRALCSDTRTGTGTPRELGTGSSVAEFYFSLL